MAGAVISPSDEDSNTFTVSPAAGESYKLRATDTRDRQMWLNRLRVVAEMHTRAIAHVSFMGFFTKADFLKSSENNDNTQEFHLFCL